MNQSEIKSQVMQDFLGLGLTLNQAKVIYNAIESNQIRFVTVEKEEEKGNKLVCSHCKSNNLQAQTSMIYKCMCCGKFKVNNQE